MEVDNFRVNSFFQPQEKKYKRSLMRYNFKEEKSYKYLIDQIEKDKLYVNQKLKDDLKNRIINPKNQIEHFKDMELVN
jgi:hypothetical protein